MKTRDDARQNSRALIAVCGLGLAFICGLGCAPEHVRPETESSLDVPATDDQIQIFQSTLYEFGSAQGCATCHGVRVSPAWMNSDVAAAYRFARPFVDFSNPTASVFAKYAGNGHCNDPICSNSANSAVVQGLLSQWASAEIILAGGGAPVREGSSLANPAFVTVALTIPSSLPLLTAANPTVMRFPLGQLTPPVPGLSGAVLEISIRSFNTANNKYKLSNPRIVGATSPVSMSGIHVYVRPLTGTGLGVEDINQGLFWSSVSTVVPILAIPNPMPAGPLSSVAPLSSVSLGIEAQSNADVLTIGFARIQ